MESDPEEARLRLEQPRLEPVPVALDRIERRSGVELARRQQRLLELDDAVDAHIAYVNGFHVVCGRP